MRNVIGSVIGVALVAVAVGMNAKASMSVEAHPSYNKDCTLIPGDIYDPAPMFRVGPYKGKCMLDTTNRSVILLDDNEKDHYSLPLNQVALANFSHENKYWIASMDTSGIDEVIFQTEYFPAAFGIPAAHTELRFKMKPGSEINLIEQNPAPGAEPTRMKMSNFTYSVEAVRPFSNEHYDVIKGVMAHYGLAYRFVSQEDRYIWMVPTSHHTVKQVTLLLNDRQKQEILETAIKLSDQKGMDQIYDTVNYSCTTELFKVVDGVVQYHSFRKMAVHLNAILGKQTDPPMAEDALRIRGLFGKRLPLMADDKEMIATFDPSHLVSETSP